MTGSELASLLHSRAPGLTPGHASAVLRHLPPPGFSSVLIPIPHGALYLNSFDTPAATTTAAVPSRRRSPRTLPAQSDISSPSRRRPHSGPEPVEAFTLLIVDDNPINRKVFGNICQRFGQPYELAENGQQAVDMYKQDPKRFRCILMDLVMPVLDGFAATRQIRAFEEETWESFMASGHTTSQRPGTTPSAPAPRAVIIAFATSLAVSNLGRRFDEAGFDLAMCGPISSSTLDHLLFSGPGANIVSVYGAVEDQALRDAGYPLKPRRPGQVHGNERNKAAEIVELWRVRSED